MVIRQQRRINRCCSPAAETRKISNKRYISSQRLRLRSSLFSCLTCSDDLAFPLSLSLSHRIMNIMILDCHTGAYWLVRFKYTDVGFGDWYSRPPSLPSSISLFNTGAAPIGRSLKRRFIEQNFRDERLAEATPQTARSPCSNDFTLLRK